MQITPRRFTKLPPEEFRLFQPQSTRCPIWCSAGEGYRFHVTGLTHDERGYPSMNIETQDRTVRRLIDKIDAAGRSDARYSKRKTWRMPKW